LDGAPSPNSDKFPLKLILRQNPNITGVSEIITADLSGTYEMTIQGSNFMSVDQSEIIIMLTNGNNLSETHTCVISKWSDSEIDCMAPHKPIGTTLSVQVMIGNLVFPLDGSSAFTVTYVQLQPASDVGLIIGIIVSFFIIVIVIIIVIVLVVNVIVFKYCQTSKTENSAKMIEGNQVVLMSDNVVYSGNTNVPFSQSNPAYVAASDVHMYEELPYSAGAKSSDEVPPNLPERLPTDESNTEPIESTNVKPEDHTAEPDDDYVEPFETNVEPDDDYVEPFESNAEPDDDYIEPFESI
jgi:plexin A